MVYRKKVMMSAYRHFDLMLERMNSVLTAFCSSGGIERSWIGVPRRYFDSSTKVERCVCVEKPNEQDGRFKLYKDCSPSSSECQILE